jgi:hypothetical protein
MPRAVDPFGRAAAAFIIAVVALQIGFLLFDCHWDLAGDEAEFWAWSRHLDWSYFARGPLIAWLIRLSTELLGGLSVRFLGSLDLAVRLPAVLLGAVTAWGVFRLAEVALQDRRAGMLAVFLLPAIPAMAAGCVLMTCDTPMVSCWTWAAVWTMRAVRSDQIRTWVLAGLVGAVGVTAKYTTLAFPVATALFLLLSEPNRRHLRRPGFWLMSSLCIGLGLAPILCWNACHDWVGLGQLARRVGLSHAATWCGIGPILTFLGADMAALGLIWWVTGALALRDAVTRVVKSRAAKRPAHEERTKSPQACHRSGLLFLLCLWCVVWSACVVASALGETEVNWLAPAYIALVVLIASRAGRMITRNGLPARRYVGAWVFSVALVIAFHHTEWFYPALAGYVPAPTEKSPAPLRLLDPTNRMRGYRTLAQAVERHREALAARGDSPFVLTGTYALTSSLSYYLPGHPESYCLSWNYGMTASPVNQHDLWHPNPRHDLGAFRGKPALVVEDANMPPSMARLMVKKGVFGRGEFLERVVVKERGLVVGAWDVSLCHDYRGIASYKQNPLAR